MQEIAIDIETFSSTDLLKTGVHKYAESPDFEIMLFGYSIDYGPHIVVDLYNGEEVPYWLHACLTDPNILKTAYNAAFEIACINAHFGITLDVSQWSCTQALAAQAGLPFGLDMVTKVLDTGAQKDPVGKALIKYFSVPCKPVRSNGMRTRNLPEHDPAKWKAFIEYCARDVAAEQSIRLSVLAWFKPLPFEDKLWVLDQKINTRGVMVDMQLVNNALLINDIETEALMADVQESTGIVNPNSDAQIKDYIFEQTGFEVASLNKENMPDVYKALVGYPEIIGLLDKRKQLSRSSIKSL